MHYAWPLKPQWSALVHELKIQLSDDLVAAYYLWPSLQAESRPTLQLVFFDFSPAILESLKTVIQDSSASQLALEFYTYAEFSEYLLDEPLLHWQLSSQGQCLYGEDIAKGLPVNAENLRRAVQHLLMQEQRYFREQYLWADLQELPALLQDAHERFGRMKRLLLFLRGAETADLPEKWLIALYGLSEPEVLEMDIQSVFLAEPDEWPQYAWRWERFLMELQQKISHMTGSAQVEERDEQLFEPLLCY